jgi:N-acetylmuramoyl-L-alanine amidase
MGRQHVVRQGECLSSIARTYGFADYRTIWDDAQNATLKRERKNPDLLFPGDKLFIPEKGGREETGGTESRHRFVTRSTSVRLELAIRVDNEPVSGKPYTLRVGDRELQGTTDGDGVLRETIDPTAAHGHLRFDDPPLEWNLEIGHLDPVGKDTGVQARLNNLDHPCGDADGIPGPRTRAAVRQFQSRHGLRVTGAIDAATRDALRKTHDEA